MIKFPRGLTACLLLSLACSVPAFASGIVYTCDTSTLSSAACSSLSTVETIYSSTFSNANATIYVTTGASASDVSDSHYEWNPVTYTSYLSALQSTVGSDTVQQDAIASLPSTEPSVFESGNINLTTALAVTLGFSSITFSDDDPLLGMTSTLSPCTNPEGAANGCYDGVITVSSSDSFWYGTGTQTGSEYDFLSIVQHETDEILGTGSCFDVDSGPTVVDACGDNSSNAPYISAVDLFRYSGSGVRAYDTTNTAYFSYNGGVSNGAQGADYNSTAVDEDYGDFSVPASPNQCTGHQFVQDDIACAGFSQNITTDGTNGGPGPEITILEAVGYNLSDTDSVPEPGTLGLLTLSLAVLGAAVIRRRRGASEIPPQ